MITDKNIEWYLENPDRLLYKKPFTRGGAYFDNIANLSGITTKTKAVFSNIKMKEISQDVYLQEYDPSLHKIIYNRSIPHIAVKLGDSIIDIDDMTITESLQKNIHARHTRYLTTNQREFILCNRKIDNDIKDLFIEYKQQWLMRNMSYIDYKTVAKCGRTSDVAVLFRYDASIRKGSVNVYSYDKGYIAIPNYNEYGEQIACSLYYTTDEKVEIIDTYDDTYHYRFSRNKENKSGWEVKKEIHGFPECPLLYRRGNVSWEYGESLIEMIELMRNIHAITLKRFGTFGLVLKGQMGEDSFKRDSTTLVINLPADESGSKMDAKVLEFPEPKGMLDFVESLRRDLQIACSVTFMTPTDLKVGGDIGGNAIQFAMMNDLAVATQSAMDWSPFTNKMATLFAEMLSLESNQTNKFNKLQIMSKFSVWTPESQETKISNLAIEQQWLSKQTVVENSPHATPDEMERIKAEEALKTNETVKNVTE